MPALDPTALRDPVAVEHTELLFHRPMHVLLVVALVAVLLHSEQGVMVTILRSNAIQSLGQIALVVYLFHVPVGIMLTLLDDFAGGLILRFLGLLVALVVILFSLAALHANIQDRLKSTWFQ